MQLCAEQIPDVGSRPLDAPVLAFDLDLSVLLKKPPSTSPKFFHSDAYRIAVGPIQHYQTPR